MVLINPDIYQLSGFIFQAGGKKYYLRLLQQWQINIDIDQWNNVKYFRLVM